MSGDFRLAFARNLLGLGPDEEIEGTFPVWRDDGPCAGRLLGMKRELSYRLASRNEFPVPVLDLGGNRYRVSTFRLLALLGLDGEARADAPDSGSPGLVVQQGSQASNGRPEGEEPLALRSTLGAGGSSSSGSSR